MGEFSDKITQKQESREKERARRENLGKFFYDLAKLAFGSVVLGIIVPWITGQNIENAILAIITGILFTIIFAVTANRIFR